MNLFSGREDQRVFEAGRRYFSTAFPNPNRVGCPGTEVLRDIAFRKVDRSTAKQWHTHLMQCSPCFVEYVAFRDQARRLHMMRRVATAAAIAIVCVGLWFAYRAGIFHPSRTVQVAHGKITYLPKHANLRDLAPLRGAEGKPLPPLEFARDYVDLTLDLPIGNEPGQYDVEIAEQLDQPLVTATGTASLMNGVAELEVKLNLITLHPGLYYLAVRQPGQSWAPFTVLLK